MKLFHKLFRRKDDHETWLAKHPGKDAPKSQPATITPEESQDMRDRMEAELSDQRARREAQ